MTAEAPTKIEPALWGIPQVIQYLNICRAEFYRWDATGKFAPLPLGLCRKRLYLRAEVEAWLQAGCVHRKIWQTQKRKSDYE